MYRRYHLINLISLQHMKDFKISMRYPKQQICNAAENNLDVLVMISVAN